MNNLQFQKLKMEACFDKSKTFFCQKILDVVSNREVPESLWYTAQSIAEDVIRTTKDENDDALEELRALNDVLAQAGPQLWFDGELFEQIVTGITAVSPTLLRFKLPGGLELEEAVSRTERRVSA